MRFETIGSQLSIHSILRYFIVKHLRCIMSMLFLGFLFANVSVTRVWTALEMSFNDLLGPCSEVGNLASTSKTALLNQSKDEVHATVVGTLSAEREAGPWTPTSSNSGANSDDRSPTPN